jgi:microfibrillar-associated protein 1
MKRQAELEERRKQSTHLAGEAIKRALAGKDKSEVAGLKDVDDTDGTDDQGEFEQWKLRELMRVKREKEVNVE